MNEFEILRKLDIDIIDFLETPCYLPFQSRCMLALLAKKMREKRMYHGRLVFRIPIVVEEKDGGQSS